MLNIRDLSIRCGRCLNYQTLVAYRPRDTWNVYVYECDATTCDPEASRTLVEVPQALDEFAQTGPGCGGSCGFGPGRRDPPATV